MSGIGFLGRIIAPRTLVCGRTASGHHLAALSTAVPDAKLESEPAVKPFSEIPGPKGIYRWPVIGTMLHFKPFTNITAETVNLLMNQMLEKYGPVVRLQMGKPRVLIGDPKDLETVYRHEGKYPLRPSTDIGLAYSRRNKLRDSIADLQGEEWHALRAPLNKRLMKVGSAHFYLEPQNAVADDFVDILSNQKLKPEDLADLFFRYTAESIGVVCFNSRLGFLDMHSQDPDTQAFLQASKDMIVYFNQAVTGESVAHAWYRNKTYIGYESTKLVLRANAGRHTIKAKEVLESRKREGTLDPEEPNLLLSLLSDSSLSEDDILNMMETLYVAGTDSTAKNLQTFFYNLAKNPDKQEKLRQEVIEVMGPNGPMSKESISRMPYLKACLKESFRLYHPLVSLTVRILPTDVVLSGYKVPAGTLIALHNHKISKDYFTDPEKYIPERWLRSSDGQRAEDLPKTASLPFGYGPRNCIGRRFAEQEIYLGAAKVLQKLKIDIEPESRNTNFIYTLFVQPERPIKFKFSKLSG